jgi:hypothetical protein
VNFIVDDVHRVAGEDGRIEGIHRWVD